MTKRYPSALACLRASRQQEMASLRQLLDSGKLATEVSQLIHELQRERGASNIWLCSAGQLFADELAGCERRVAESEARVMALLPALPQEGADCTVSARLFSALAVVVQALSEFRGLRQRVRQRQLSDAQAMNGFNDLIRQLLHLVYEMVDTASDPQVSRALIAMFSFMQGKELAGQERAVGAAGFASGRLPSALRQQIPEMIEAQERCFGRFSEFADAGTLQYWRSGAAGEVDVERLRRIACTQPPPDEQGVEMALRWYRTLSQRIDRMKTVEDRLASVLMQCCRHSIAEMAARAEPGPADLQQLSERRADEAAWSVFYSGCQSSGIPGLALQSDGVAPRLGRSLLTLVEQQSKRLQHLDNEVAAMRNSMEERKQIDRAKVLLMQHHRCGEEQAWQTLRKMAMDQNKRMVEIAAALLAVAPAFTHAEK